MCKKILTSLYSGEYEHLLDKRALKTLEGTPGLETLTKLFNKNFNDKMFKIQYTGSNIKVTDKNYPEIYNALLEVCSILFIKNIPDLYVQWDYSINAFTAGTEKPIIVLNSGCVDLLSYEELLYVIGHEVGHIKSKHVLYHQMAQLLPFIGDLIGSITFGIGDLLSKGIQIALLNWVRMSEFTADRAGLLACQDVNAVNTALIKIAGVPLKHFNSINVDEFVKQAKAFKDYDYDAISKVIKILSIMNMSHPWTVMRAAELIKWVESGEYDRILRTYSGEIGRIGGNQVSVTRD